MKDPAASGSTGATKPPLVRQRLRQKDLVLAVFYLFYEEFEKTAVESIWQIVLPMDRIKGYLKQKHNITYTSDLWLYSQLKRYEDELRVKLFRRVKRNPESPEFSLGIHEPYLNFFQKQHLYISQKIKVANGVYDRIRNSALSSSGDRAVKILLGAGSTTYHLANILAEKSWEGSFHSTIYTHNLGALQLLLGSGANTDNIDVWTPMGRVDPVTYTIVGDSNTLFTSTPFDFIIQGTSCLCAGKLYIESHEEVSRKKAILMECKGEKILVLTKHECSESPIQGIKSYGSLQDYDFVVVPKRGTDTGPRKKCELLFDSYMPMLEPDIISWNYVIYRVARKDRRKG